MNKMRRVESMLIACKAKPVGMNASIALFVLDGQLYGVGKCGGVCLGDWYAFCYEYRRNRSRGTLPASCRLFHIDGPKQESRHEEHAYPALRCEGLDIVNESFK